MPPSLSLVRSTKYHRVLTNGSNECTTMCQHLWFSLLYSTVVLVVYRLLERQVSFGLDWCVPSLYTLSYVMTIFRLLTNCDSVCCFYSAPHAKLTLQALSMLYSTSVRPSHSGIVSKRGIAEGCVLHHRVSLVFWCQEWLMGVDPVQVKFECKEVDRMRKQPSCTHFAS